MTTTTLLALSGSASAAGDPPGTVQERRQSEQPADPPAIGPWDWFDQPGVQPANAFGGVQANVNAAQQNILGDAANEPSIAVDPRNRNRIAIGWRQFDSVSSNFREAGTAYSRDGGRTWKATTLDNGVFRSDPVLRANADGRIYYYSLTNSGGFICHVFYSDDGGRTWSAPIPAFGGDKPWIAVDRSGGIGDGNFYSHWTSAGWCGVNTFTRSTNDATSFMSPIPMPDRPDWGMPAIQSNGDLFIGGNDASNLSSFRLIRSQNAKDPAVTPTFNLSVSVDLGGSQGFNAGPNPAGLLGQVSLVADTSSGPYANNLYMLCSVNPAGADPLDVRIVRSTNGGANWSAPIDVTDEPGNVNEWQWFGTLGIAPSGRLDCIWNDTRDTGLFNLSALRYSQSTDGGLTWAPSIVLGPIFNSFTGWPNQNKIGDYYDIESDDVGFFAVYAATYNNEQDVYVIRVGDYDCNGNGIGDAAEIAAGATDENSNAILDACECIGDINGDDAIGQADLAALLAGYNLSTGDPGFNPAADLNADGTVGQADLALLLARYGQSCI